MLIDGEKDGDKPEDKVEYVLEDDTSDKRVQDSDDDEHEDDDDERVAKDQRDDELEVRRQERRDQRKVRKEKQRAARERSERIIQTQSQKIVELEQRLQAMEGRGMQSEVESIEQKIAIAQQHIQAAITNQATAIGRKDDKLWNEAKEYEANAREHHRKLVEYKEATLAAENAKRVRAPKNDISEQTKALANQWIANNTWFDPQGRDELSRTALNEDIALKNEGYNPETKEYWRELTRRVRNRSGDDVGEEGRRSGRRGPPIGGGSNAAGGTKKPLALGKERRQALMDAGVDPDGPDAKPYMEAFAKYDRESSAR